MTSKNERLQKIARDLLEKYVDAQETVICEFSHDIEGDNERLQQYKQEMLVKIVQAARPGPNYGSKRGKSIDKAKLKALMREKKLRWADIAPQIGYSTDYCVNRTHVGYMSPEMIRSVAEILGVDPEELEAKE